MSNHTTLIFSINNKVGSLSEVLHIIQSFEIDLSRIESRPSKTKQWDYDFFIDFEGAATDKVEKLIEALKSRGIGIDDSSSASSIPLLTQSGATQLSSNRSLNQVPWFPRKMADLDSFSNKVLEFGAELDADHPGFKDPVYRKRRVAITENATKFKYGEKIPTVDYTPEEIATWKAVYNNLTSLYPTHACQQYNYVFPLLVQNCGYGPDNIPQLEDVSIFLQECTGWRLRPVTGLLTARDFLNGLAFRVFHSTQYIRHHSNPMYTPEPDVCHELLGHVPLYADPDFADFSQEIGLASLGASDEDIDKLATLYWFTVEYGVCKENGEIKAFGAGLLSSFGELKYCLGGDDTKPQYLTFDPKVTTVQKYPITSYQPLYFVAESFQDAKEKVIEYANSLQRPFGVRYNPLTLSIEILDTKQKLTRFVKDIQEQLATLSAALEKLPGLN